jgi:hypothetical protein
VLIHFGWLGAAVSATGDRHRRGRSSGSGRQHSRRETRGRRTPKDGRLVRINRRRIANRDKTVGDERMAHIHKL